MKTKKLTALILSILMIASLLPTTIFAAPAAVTVSDTAHEHPHVHNSEHADSASLAAEGTLEVKLYDSFGDTWNGAALLVYKGVTLVATLEPESRLNEDTVTIDGYNDIYPYSFVWQKGSYDDECSFDIIVNAETVFSADGATLSAASDGAALFTLLSSCTHEIGEGTLVCISCGLTCGTDFAHDFNEENICSRCSAKCGTEESPHDWKNEDGICAFCEAECTHSFTDNACTVCGFVKAAYVTAGDNTTYYLTLEEALEEAAKTENSTLYLNKSVYADTILIDEGAFTLNLNGYDLTLYDCVNVDGTAQLIIDGQGSLRSEETLTVLYIVGSSVVTVKNGVFDSYVSVDGANSSLIVEGGMFDGDISVYNGKATFKGGTDEYFVLVYGGSLVFEAFEGIENIIIDNQTETFSNIALPEGYAVVDPLLLEAEELEIYVIYRIAKESDISEIPFGIHILMVDRANDTWDDAKIEIYKDEELVGTAEIAENDIVLDSFNLEYDSESAYTFKWKTGNYDTECSFAIFVDKELRYKAYNAQDDFAEADATILELEVDCSHEIQDGSSICIHCEGECGKDFAHAFGEDTTCDRCGFVCGTQDSPHSYKDGVCTVCKTECSHSFADNVCDTCEVVRVATVKVGEKTHDFDSFYDALELAIANENSTITLYDDIDLGDSCSDIEEGTFTLDLNGHTVTSQSFTFYLSGSADVTVCDSSSSKAGKIETTAYSYSAVMLINTSRFTLNGGTLSNTVYAGTVVDTRDNGNATDATFIMNGGKIIVAEYGAAIMASCTLVHVKGGEVSGRIEYTCGTLSFEGHPNPSGIEVVNNTIADMDASDIVLPRGCYFEDASGETAETLESYETYTIAGTPEIVIAIGERADSANSRCLVINGVRNSEAIAEENDEIVIPAPEEDTLVEVIEKASADDTTAVYTQYFFIDAETGEVTTLSLDNYSTMYDETQVRTTGNMGMRFMADIMASVKNEEENYVIDEYGFIVAAAYNLENATDLTVNSPNFVQGVAYNKKENIDLVFDSSNDDYPVFAGVLVNVPVKNYKTDVVCRTYTKITVGTSQFIIYGEPVTGNIYDTAKSVLETIPDDAALQKIVDDYDNYVNGDMDSEVGVPSPEF